MKTRPKKLDYLALFVLGIALALPIQIMALYGHSPLETTAIFTKLAPLNLIVMLLAPLTAWFIYRASPLTVIAVPILCMVVARNNWLVSELSTDYSPSFVGLTTGMFFVVMASVFARETREIILDPSRRWWLTPRRKRVALPAHIVVPGHGEHTIDLVTYDISETGAFLVPLPSGPKAFNDNLKDLPNGTDCSVSIELETKPGEANSKEKPLPLQCRAEIVRTTDGRGQYPIGVGIRFSDLRWKEKKTLQALLDDEKERQLRQQRAS